MKKIFLGVCAILFVSAIVNAQVLQQDLALKYLVQQPTGKTTKPPVVIFMHGYGSNEQDLFELKTYLPKNFMVVSVRAPYPAGNGGYQWFEIGALNNRSGSKQLAESRGLVTKFISQVTAKYHADAKVYLIGFSQGAMMCYEAGLTNAGKVKGIAPLSGKMYPSLKNELKISPELKQMKIFIAHGTADDRISFADGKAASNNLVSIGLRPEFHEYAGMGHSINNDVLKDLVIWIQK